MQGCGQWKGARRAAAPTPSVMCIACASHVHRMCIACASRVHRMRIACASQVHRRCIPQLVDLVGRGVDPRGGCTWHRGTPRRHALARSAAPVAAVARLGARTLPAGGARGGGGGRCGGRRDGVGRRRQRRGTRRGRLRRRGAARHGCGRAARGCYSGRRGGATLGCGGGGRGRLVRCSRRHRLARQARAGGRRQRVDGGECGHRCGQRRAGRVVRDWVGRGCLQMGEGGTEQLRRGEPVPALEEQERACELVGAACNLGPGHSGRGTAGLKVAWRLRCGIRAEWGWSATTVVFRCAGPSAMVVRHSRRCLGGCLPPLPKRPNGFGEVTNGQRRCCSIRVFLCQRGVGEDFGTT